MARRNALPLVRITNIVGLLNYAPLKLVQVVPLSVGTLNHKSSVKIRITCLNLVTARNEVGARLCFYTCLSFCSQGGSRSLSRWSPSQGGLCPRGVSVWRGLCLEGSLSQGVSWGSLSRRGVSVGGFCPRRSLSRGSLSGGSLSGGLCPGVSLSRVVSVQGVSVWGSLSRGVSVQGGLCPGCLSMGVSVQGGLCLGGLCHGDLSIW